MEEFSFRSLLYWTLNLAAAGTIVGFAAALSRALAPAFRRKARMALPEGAGSVDVDLPDDGGRMATIMGGLSWLTLLLCAACFLVNLAAMLSRAVEVQHWPAQTMYEVIPLGTTACFLSVLVLYFVLGIHRMTGFAKGFGDLFVALILLGSVFTLRYVLRLDPTGRALPPALQSYWFPTHISAYMFGYFTLFIATLGTWLYFCFKFSRAILDREGYEISKVTKWGILFMALVPAFYGRLGILFGPGVLALTFVISLLAYRQPGGFRWFDSWEKGGADRFSWLIFVVGFPFLTAGIVQGALWAQEAWALYWGWDSKEVSALISWLFYVVYLHLRYVAGWRGERAMAILYFGGLSIYITFQLFGDLPASQSSLHRYTDMDVVPAEGMMEPEAPPGTQ